MRPKADGVAATAHDKRLTPALASLAPENPPRPPRSWSGHCGFEGIAALEAMARRVVNLEMC